MPWTAKDAQKHIKGLQGGQATKWAKVANGVLSSCQKSGGTDCEGTAIRVASKLARRRAQAEALQEQLTGLELEEAGRVFAKRNVDRLKAALNLLNSALQEQPDDEDPEKATEKLGTAVKAASKAVAEAFAEEPVEGDELEEAERSYDERRMLVGNALRAAMPDKSYPYIRDMFDDAVIFEASSPSGEVGGGGLFRAPYAIDSAKATVTLGEPTKVVEKKEYVAVSEAADVDGDGEPGQLVDEAEAPGSGIVLLEEKAVHADGTVPIKIASPGWGSKGYYSKKLLETDGPKTWPKGTQMYWNHPTAAEEAARPERNLADLAAVTVKDPFWDDNGPAGAGLYTSAKVFKQYAEAVDEMAPHIGVSLRANGIVTYGEAEGKTGPLVESFLNGKSIDFVTKAGRGGEVVSLFESAGGGGWNKDVYAASHQPGNPGPQEDDVSKEELEEAQRIAAAATTRSARLEEALAVRDARDYAGSLLSRAVLPEAAKARIIDALVLKAPLSEAKDDELRVLDRPAFKALVEAAAKEEASYLALATGNGGRVVGLGEAAGDPFNPVAPEALDEAAVEAKLAASFRGIGLSEEAAGFAAKGR